MASLRVRLVIGLFVLLVSLAILIWAVWPMGTARRVVPISPSDMQLPTPHSEVIDFRLAL